MDLASDTGTFGDRCRAGVVVAGVLQLGEKQLGPVLAQAGPAHQCAHDPEHDTEQHRTGDVLAARVAREGKAETDRHWDADKGRGWRGEPDSRHEDGGTCGQFGRGLRLECGERDPGRAAA